MAHCRVLVVDDDDDTREALLDLLRMEDYDAFGARDGRDALDCLEKKGFAPDVIIMDEVMPGLSGADFRAALQADPRWAHVPIIVCSGSEQRIVSPGTVVGVLQKPLDVDALLAVVKRGCSLAA